MGIALTGLIDAAMGDVEPAYAGAVSGVLSTAQQVGNALGVAVVGMVFFGAVDGGYGHALEWSLVVLAATTAGVALLGTLLRPGLRRRRPRPRSRPPPSPDDAPAPRSRRRPRSVEEVALRPSRNHRGATS